MALKKLGLVNEINNLAYIGTRDYALGETFTLSHPASSEERKPRHWRSSIVLHRRLIETDFTPSKTGEATMLGTPLPEMVTRELAWNGQGSPESLALAM